MRPSAPARSPSRRSPVTRGTGTTYLIRWTGSFTGAPPVHQRHRRQPPAGLRRSATISEMSSGYIDHSAFETFVFGLGSGDDLFDVDSTPSRPHHHRARRRRRRRPHRRDDLRPHPAQRRRGSGQHHRQRAPDQPHHHGLALRWLLASQRRRRLRHLHDPVFGAGSSRIDVADGLGSTDGGSNTLIVNGTVAGHLPAPLRPGRRAQHARTPSRPASRQPSSYAERVNYDENINGGLSSTASRATTPSPSTTTRRSPTLNGGAGDDSFQFGQLYGERRSRSADARVPAGPHRDDPWLPLQRRQLRPPQRRHGRGPVQRVPQPGHAQPQRRVRRRHVHRPHLPDGGRQPATPTPTSTPATVPTSSSTP